MKNTHSGDGRGTSGKERGSVSRHDVCEGLNSLQPVASTLVNPRDNRSPSAQRALFTFRGDGCIIRLDKLCQGEIKCVPN